MTDLQENTADDSQPLRDLLAVYGQACADCKGRCSAYDVVLSIALGFKATPRCLPCLSRGLARDPAELRELLTDYIRRRECYSRAWQQAELLEAGERFNVTPIPNSSEQPVLADDGETNWDAGSMACGELVLALRVRLNSLPAGTVLRLRATDPAATEDIPAWCRLTGHTLVFADHPEYHIRRK